MNKITPVRIWRGGVVCAALGAIGVMSLSGLAQDTNPFGGAVKPPAVPPAAGGTTPGTPPAPGTPPVPGTVPAPGVPATPPVDPDAKPCLPVPQGIMSWLAGEDKGDDVFQNRTEVDETQVYAPGKVGQAFSLRGTSVKLLTSPRVDVGTGAGITWEAWINPANVSAGKPLVDFNDGTNFGVHFWIFSLDGSPGTLFANFMDTTGQPHIVSTQPSAIVANEWQHVAMTYDKKTGIGSIYVNGLPAGEKALGPFRPQTAYDLILGYRPGGLGKGMRYSGLMDEVCLYNRALTSQEIKSIHSAGAAGKCNPLKKPTPTPIPAKVTPTPLPTPTPTPLPTPTPTPIPALKIKVPLGAFTFGTVEGVDATIAARITDALTEELRKSGAQVKARTLLDRVFTDMVAEYEKGDHGGQTLAVDVRDAQQRRKAAQQMTAQTVLWGEVQQFTAAKGQPARLKFVIRLMDTASGTVIPDIVVSESTIETTEPVPDEQLIAQAIAKAIPVAAERVRALMAK